MKKSTRVAIFGGFGRMGREVAALVEKSETLNLVAVADQHTDLDVLAESKPQIVVEFSSPQGLKKIAQWCESHRVALVSGTTGVSPAVEKELLKLSKRVAVFRSANMSLGIAALAKTVGQFARDFSEGGRDIDVQVEEIHHRHKKDIPSGTALFLESQLKGLAGVNIRSAVGLRGGEIFGVHKIYFFGKSEWLCFEHHAQNRTVFAEGAVRAAGWLVGKAPGLYSMSHLLGKNTGKNR